MKASKSDVDIGIERKKGKSPVAGAQFSRRCYYRRKNRPTRGEILWDFGRRAGFRMNEGKYRMKESFCEIEVRRSGFGILYDTSPTCISRTQYCPSGNNTPDRMSDVYEDGYLEMWQRGGVMIKFWWYSELRGPLGTYRGANESPWLAYYWEIKIKIKFPFLKKLQPVKVEKVAQNSLISTPKTGFWIYLFNFNEL